MLKVKFVKRPASRKSKKPTKPLKAGTIDGVEPVLATLPTGEAITRYIITSAQNNTEMHEGTWQNLLALTNYYKATLLVGTFTYNKSAYGEASVKRGTADEGDHGSLYDPRLVQYFCDKRVQLGRGLVWCGDLNIQPTASNPLSGYDTFCGRNSCIFPHAKIAERSVASTGGSGAKLIYTTGTTTCRNYVQMKAGQKAEFNHTFGGLIVEVDSQGVWKVRQLDAETDTGTICDLNLKVERGVVTDTHGDNVEAIVFGDIHATIIDPTVLALSATAPGNMIDFLKPKYVVIHDLMEGASVNHHDVKKPVERFKKELRDLTVVQHELQATAEVLTKYYRPGSQIVVVNSNHDRWLDLWLDTYNAQKDDVRNLEIYHDGNAARLKQQRLCGSAMNVLEYLLRNHTDCTAPARFLGLDEPFLLCDNRLECYHGDLGPNGTRGSAPALSKVGRRAIIGHSHVAGIWDGLYSVGTSTELRMGYNHGPSAWTHSHVIVYKNGKRAIVTMYEGKWKA
jgi:hypothetical protein